MCMRRPTVSLHSAGKKRDKLKCNFPNMRMHCMTNGNEIKKNIKVNKEYISCVFWQHRPPPGRFISPLCSYSRWKWRQSGLCLMPLSGEERQAPELVGMLSSQPVRSCSEPLLSWWDTESVLYCNVPGEARCSPICAQSMRKGGCHRDWTAVTQPLIISRLSQSGWFCLQIGNSFKRGRMCVIWSNRVTAGVKFNLRNIIKMFSFQ